MGSRLRLSSCCSALSVFVDEFVPGSLDVGIDGQGIEEESEESFSVFGFGSSVGDDSCGDVLLSGDECESA